jgi:hypothetical protein
MPKLTDLLLIATACFCGWAVSDTDGAERVLRGVIKAVLAAAGAA